MQLADQSGVQTWFNHEEKNHKARQTYYAKHRQNLEQNLVHDLL